MHKSLVIGIGGTGLATIHEIRRLIAERFKEGLEDSGVAPVRFIYIDTTENDINSEHQWEVLGKDIKLREEEKVIVTGDGLDDVVKNPEDHDWARDWLPNLAEHYIGTAAEGAKGIRPYGRMIYEHMPNKTKIKEKIDAAYATLDNRFGKLNEWRFYLVCGLSGGTGSGMFLPLAKDLSARRGGVYTRGGTQKFRAFLVLPPISISGRHSRYHANAYAALSELNFESLPPQVPPFDNCYLLETRNEAGNSLILESLPVLIAQRIFLNIQQGNAANSMESMMDDELLGQIEERTHACCFSSFGLSVVSYPREIIAQCLAYKLAARVVRSWLRTPPNAPGNVNNIVEGALDEMFVSKRHVLADTNPFQEPSYALYEPYERQIPSAVNQRIKYITKKELGGNADQIRDGIKDTFRGRQGIVQFYEERLKDVQGHRDAAEKAVRKKISSYLRDPDYGLNFAKKFLKTLVAVLTELKQETSAGASENQNKRVDSYYSKLEECITKIKTNETAWLYTGSRFDQDRKNLAIGLTGYLVELAHYHASRYGDQFLGGNADNDGVISRITKLSTELDVWATRADEMAKHLEGALDDRLAELSSGMKENGEVIFDKDSLDALVQDTPDDKIVAGVEGQIQTRKGTPQESLDLIGFVSPANVQNGSSVQDSVYRATYDWIVDKDCPINIFQDSFYDKFTAKYPDIEKRRDILKTTRDRSAPFIKFSGDEYRMNVNPATRRAVTKPVETGGILADGRSAKLAVSDDLVASGAVEIKEGNDPERIVFLQEVHPFPLRLIDTLHFLKGKYDEFRSKELLHTDRTKVPQLPDLYLLTQAQKDRQNEAEKCFVLGRALGWLKEEVNLHTSKQEIRYERQSVLGPERLILGEGWEEAMHRFLKNVTSNNNQDPDIRKVFKLLAERTRLYLEDCQRDEGKKVEFGEVSNKYLAERAEEYPARRDDPRFERDFGILSAVAEAIGLE